MDWLERHMHITKPNVFHETHPVAQGGGHAGLVLEGHAGNTAGAAELGGGGHKGGGAHEGGDGEQSGGLHLASRV